MFNKLERFASVVGCSLLHFFYCVYHDMLHPFEHGEQTALFDATSIALFSSCLSWLVIRLWHEKQARPWYFDALWGLPMMILHHLIMFNHHFLLHVLVNLALLVLMMLIQTKDDPWIPSGLLLKNGVLSTSTGFFMMAAMAFLYHSIEVLFEYELWQILPFYRVLECIWVLLILMLFLIQIPAPGDMTSTFTTTKWYRSSLILAISFQVVYTLLLHSYAAHIVWQQTMPKGQLGYLVSCYALIHILTLVALQIGSASHRGLGWYPRWSVATMAVPLIMLTTAIAVRVLHHGLSERRFALILWTVGCWHVLISQCSKRPTPSWNRSMYQAAAFWLIAGTCLWCVMQLYHVQ